MKHANFTGSLETKVEHKDRPRLEAIASAQAVIDRAAGRAKIYFKTTCPQCGCRITLDQSPNVLPDIGDCAKCNLPFAIDTAGYMILLSMPSAVQSTTEGPKDESISS